MSLQFFEAGGSLQYHRWLRWRVGAASLLENREGNLLLTGDERAEQERQRADRLERQQQAVLQLLEFGLSAEQVAAALALSVQAVKAVSNSENS